MLNNTRTYSDIWQNCLDQIKARTSAEEFEKWFQPIVPLEFDGTTLRLRVPNESYVRQIEKNYIRSSTGSRRDCTTPCPVRRLRRFP
jgi:chromosomal replication initiator protein